MNPAKRYLISGRVQGVGFRYFAQRNARELGVSGWARNLEDGRVEVQASGPAASLSEFEARLRTGPPHSDVRAFEIRESSTEKDSSFHIR